MTRSVSAAVRRRATADGGDLASTSRCPISMLLPLIEVAADVLQELELVDVPSSLRPLHGFDRRGLLAGPAPAPAAARAAARPSRSASGCVERFLARPRSRRCSRAWTIENAAPMAAAAARLRRPRAVRVGAVGGAARRATRSGSASPSCSTRRCATASARPTPAGAPRRNAPRSKKPAGAPKPPASRPTPRAARRAGVAEGTHEPPDPRRRSDRRRRRRRRRQADALQTELDQAHAEVAEQTERATSRASQRARCARRRPATRARRHPRAPGARRERRVAARSARRAGARRRGRRSPASCRSRSTRCNAGFARSDRSDAPGRARRVTRRVAGCASRRRPAERTRSLPPGVVAELAGGCRGDARHARRRARSSTATTSRTAPGPTRPPATSASGSASRPPRCAAGSAARSCSCSTATAAGPGPRCAAAACGCCSPKRARRPTRSSCARSRPGPKRVPGGGRVVGRVGDGARRDQGAAVVGADALVRAIRPER